MRSRCTITLAFLGLACAGCLSRGDSIEGKDYHVEFPQARISLAMHTDRDGEPVEPGAQAALVLEATRARGSSRQQLGAGDTLRFKQTDFTGPGPLDVDFELDVFSLLYRGGMPLGSNFEGAVLVGGSGFSRYLHLDGVGANVSDSDFFLLPAAGAELEWQAMDGVSLYSRYLIDCDTDNHLAPVLRMFEAGLRVQPHANLALFAGWRDWRYDEQRPSESDLVFEIEGAVLGFELLF
ncbi:MAG: hypothetical protein IPJ19_04610 [Planctomycetes bacterium]|nr:hypothetical protein [Planctomycetota bacterium]